jgi:hypothetical protein
MLVIGRAGRAAVAACAAVALAGCSPGDDDSPKPSSGTIDVATMRAALLQAKDVGPTWTAPDASAAAPQLVSICGGTNAAPAVPGSPQVVTAPLVDEGDAGAQSLVQTALVYPDAAAADAGQVALKLVADACSPSVDVDARDTGDAQEPAYTETVRTSPLSQGPWSGFVVVRHKQYEPAHPSTADTAVAVLVRQNVLLFDAYAIYRLGTAGSSPGPGPGSGPSPGPGSGPQFSSDWEKLVGTVIARVDG